MSRLSPSRDRPADARELIDTAEPGAGPPGFRPVSAALRDRGAVVTGIDASAGMPALARRRLGNVTLHVADLGDPLPFDDDAFDDVVASLVLHYLEDWGPTLSELRRVIRPCGRLVTSVDHPFVAYTIQDPRPDYAATTGYTFDWTFKGGMARRPGVRDAPGGMAGPWRRSRDIVPAWR